MSADLKDKNKESIACAMKALYKMEEKRKWAEKKEKNINVEINVIFINIF